ncbi:MAG: integral rane sensor signal transduction histidine kinase [Fibrobacteria bacterium]|jgi:signal transduction histidine kinase|nr:integral rane sensor signal transduction histidine kinase [Fibrobacteria bacterium]
MALKIPRRRLLLFAVPILLPGLVLAYLSFRSVKDERLLLEKSQEARYESFADAVDRTIRKTRQAHLERLRKDLSEGGAAETPAAAWSLASRLLENPLTHSVAVFHGDTAMFPRMPRNDSGPAESLSPAAEGLRRGPRNALERQVREEWRAGLYGKALASLRLLLHGPDSLGPENVELRFGFRLMELKCLARLGDASEAVAAARRMVRDLMETSELDSYYRTGFYLSETADLMTSMENLPRDAREEFFTLHQRLPRFLSNADVVRREWPDSPEEILRSQAYGPEDSLRVQYYRGMPYLLVGFPWLDQGAQALIRLEDRVLVEALRTELQQDRRSLWKDMDFSVSNLRDETVLASEGLNAGEREPALERSFEEQFPAWRLVVYKKPAGDLIAQGRWRIGLQYTLLAFSLLSLLMGIVVLFKALADEQRLVSMKSNFISAVSHELKTPLTAIRMFSEMLASGRAAEEKRGQYAQRIGAEAERLQGMIEGILNYTRLEENPDALRFEELDLSEAARDSAALMSGAFAKAGIRLTTRLAESAPLRADYNAVRSVIQNLLENALKYSPAGSEVVLEIRALSAEIILRVADRGIGIEPADLKRIFEKFYRAGDEMTRRTRGSGLGLALVKRIVDAHGGTIKVASKPGEGTEMTIIFRRETDAPHTDR